MGANPKTKLVVTLPSDSYDRKTAKAMYLWEKKVEESLANHFQVDVSLMADVRQGLKFPTLELHSKGNVEKLDSPVMENLWNERPMRSQG